MQSGWQQAQLTGRTHRRTDARWAGREERMIKGYTAKRNAAMAAKSRTTTAKAKRGRPKKEAAPLPPPDPVPVQPQGFPLLIPEQLRTCLMSKDDVDPGAR